MIKLKAWPPVWGPQQSLQRAGKINKHVAHQEKPKTKRSEKKSKTVDRLCHLLCEATLWFLHGKDGGDWIQGSDDDANLTDASCEQESPGGLPVGFTMSKNLQQHKSTKQM